jgi:hypothetical protein
MKNAKPVNNCKTLSERHVSQIISIQGTLAIYIVQFHFIVW